MNSVTLHTQVNNICCLTIRNVCGFSKADSIYEKVFEKFAVGPTLFSSHYKQDGFNLSDLEMNDYSNVIPAYFLRRGKYIPIVKRKRHFAFDKDELVLCCSPNDNETHQMLKKVFDYYLESVFFCPKIRWENFLEIGANYMQKTCYDLISSGCADFVFSHTDSSDFSIYFHQDSFSPQVLKKEIIDLLESVGQ